jgi:hypothetical protein
MIKEKKYKLDFDEIRESSKEHNRGNNRQNRDLTLSIIETTVDSVRHTLKREIAQRLRNIPVIGEAFMGHVEDEADDPNTKIARGVRDMTKAEMFGEKARRAWGRFKGK